MENPNIREDLVRLRDELMPRAFDHSSYKHGMGLPVINSTLAEVVFKINSVLYRGYPRNHSLVNT